MLTQSVCTICDCNFFYKTENVTCLNDTLYCTKCLDNSKNKSKRKDEINDYDMFGNLDNSDDLHLNPKRIKNDNIKNNNRLYSDYRKDNNYKNNKNNKNKFVNKDNRIPYNKRNSKEEDIHMMIGRILKKKN